MGILHPEGGAAERFDEIDRAARNEIKADRVDHELHSVVLADRIVVFDRFGKPEQPPPSTDSRRIAGLACLAAMAATRVAAASVRVGVVVMAMM